MSNYNIYGNVYDSIYLNNTINKCIDSDNLMIMTGNLTTSNILNNTTISGLQDSNNLSLNAPIISIQNDLLLINNKLDKSFISGLIIPNTNNITLGNAIKDTTIYGDLTINNTINKNNNLSSSNVYIIGNVSNNNVITNNLETNLLSSQNIITKNIVIYGNSIINGNVINNGEIITSDENVNLALTVNNIVLSNNLTFSDNTIQNTAFAVIGNSVVGSYVPSSLTVNSFGQTTAVSGSVPFIPENRGYRGYGIWNAGSFSENTWFKLYYQVGANIWQGGIGNTYTLNITFDGNKNFVNTGTTQIYINVSASFTWNKSIIPNPTYTKVRITKNDVGIAHSIASLGTQHLSVVISLAPNEYFNVYAYFTGTGGSNYGLNDVNMYEGSCLTICEV